MPDDSKRISDFMKQIEEENPETTTVSSDCSSENIEPVQEITSVSEPAYPQSQELQAPAVQQTNQINNNNPQVNLAISAINAVTSATCMGRYVQIPNYPVYAKVVCDVNCNTYLGILNQQTNQYDITAKVIHKDSGYTVYQDRQKVGTLLYTSFEDTVWQFVPFGVSMPQQGQNAQYPAQNTQQTKWTFNNVPPENAEQIINNLIDKNLSNSVEVNFASTALKSGSPFIPLDDLKDIN